jgi:hypothetical protein
MYLIVSLNNLECQKHGYNSINGQQLVNNTCRDRVILKCHVYLHTWATGGEARRGICPSGKN